MISRECNFACLGTNSGKRDKFIKYVRQLMGRAGVHHRSSNAFLKEQKFFGSFFQKRTTSFLTPPAPAGKPHRRSA
jgi:hypothetical protein